MTINATESINQFVKRMLWAVKRTGAGYASWVLNLANLKRLVSTATSREQTVVELFEFK